MGHLNFEDRLMIQQMLKENCDCTEIATYLGKDRTTVSREVKRHRTYKPASVPLNICVHRRHCDIPRRCTAPCAYRRTCLSCVKCNSGCPDFLPQTCSKTTRYPYVCNGCSRMSCRLGKWLYSAKTAQKEYESSLSALRSGITLSDAELRFLNEKIVPLIKHGISVSAACAQYADQMPVSVKTLYTYIDKGYLDVKNLDLRLKVRRPLRKKTGPILRVDKKCHIGRSYAEYQNYLREHPQTATCQMDTVLGKIGGKCVLSILFTNCDLQLFYFRDQNTAATVTEVFKYLRKVLGDDFPALFQVILTDRGSEFTDPTAIETDRATGEIQCKVFYCDPQQSNQKSNCERNHELFRYIFPKGTAFERFTQDHMTLAASHINSYPRKKWNWKSPIDLFEQIYGKESVKKLGLEKIHVDKIILSPDLVK